MSAQGFDEVIHVGSRKLGRGLPCLLVAEIGINHNGDVELAKETIDAAVEAGADVVKFQNYRTEDFVSDRILTLTYKSRGEEITESQFDLFKRCELDLDALGTLKDHCDTRDVVFQSAPTSADGIEDLLRIGTLFLKNGSDYLVNIDLVRAMGESGLPTVLSTGMATLAEIDEAVQAFGQTGNSQLVLLHCVSSYPAPAQETNLERITSLKRAFGCEVGFSDHTQGSLAAALSVTFGACLIEKHFTLDANLPGPDHWFSATPESFASLASNVRTAEAMIGSPTVQPVESEMEGRRLFRLSCVAAASLPAGHNLKREDIAFRRPGTGVAPIRSSILVGRTLREAVDEGHVFGIGDFL